MFSLRYLTRIKDINFVKTVKFNNLRYVPETVSFNFTRNYAKGKDKKKEKSGSKKPVKIEINEEQLKNIINIDSMNKQMQKSLDTMRDEFIKNLSLRSTTGSIEALKVKIDGKDHELQELAQITRKNPKTIIVNMIAFPQTIPTVLQAIQKSGMNLNPQQDGTTLFIPVPKLTKEHRENLAKSAKTLFIKCRDSIKDTQNTIIKKVKRQEDISIDENHQVQNQVTAIADKYIADAEKLLDAKQAELIGGSKD